ncbi:GntR family transcriptional regulator [Microbacterium sp. No. 7]|uniref:GntR family transcriptional regulator n=1 Tax=Microbacterium sp. No. 7 TaxID=1714373 RepID=UPI0006D03D8A|nr:GntR family transcriptional regulator [Microbacterium sp. No. 7]ALJ19271.1 GntR family transcriptional regulator [Microbacterium sp. No. 7]
MRRQLSDEVVSYLRQAIMAGEFAPGEAVRAEVVGEALEVSATPVREAFQALRAEGFLELVPRKGFTVAPLTAADIRDIFEAHALLAGELTARAARNATRADLDALEALHRELMDAAEGGDTALLEQKNHEFHRAIYRLAGSERLRWALGTFAKYVPRAFYAEIEGWPETTVADHGAVMTALVAADADAAREAMAAHIRNSGEKLAEHFAATRPHPAPESDS